MQHVPCNPDIMGTRDCPVSQFIGGCRTDRHHLFFYKKEYRTKVEQAYRGEPFALVDMCRGIHRAIHMTNYKPEKPSKQEMLDDIWNNHTSERAAVELETQVAIGQAMLQLQAKEAV